MTPATPDLEPLSGLDGAFISLETPATPMHVGSVNVFALPAGYAGDWLADVKAWLAQRLPPVLRRQLVSLPLQWAHPVWQQVEVDLDRHVQRAAIPAPGGWAQLEDRVAQLHAQPLDRSRPLWQLTVLDGLASGERALYFKIHHAMLDGQAAAALAARLLDTAPGDWPAARASTAPPSRPTSIPSQPSGSGPSWVMPKTRSADAAQAVGSGSNSPGSGTATGARASVTRPPALQLMQTVLAHDARAISQLARGLPGAWDALRGLVRSAAAGELDLRAALPTPRQDWRDHAPRTRLNGPITSERAYAALSLPLAEVKAMARACRVSANDVVLTACGGALRRYLGRWGPLPEASLTALMALSLRGRHDAAFHNLATLTLVSLATHLAHPLQRLQAVHAHTRATKVLARQAQPLMPTDFPTLGQPWLVSALSQAVARAGTAERLPALAHVLVSSVTGPARPLYLGPARMTGCWPISIVEHGMGVNLTLLRYTDRLFAGLTVARTAVPEVRLLADDLLQAYAELKMAALAPAHPLSPGPAPWTDPTHAP